LADYFKTKTVKGEIVIVVEGKKAEGKKSKEKKEEQNDEEE
jgi:16S rRNA C1402 (ribose-2'-O) methylase RsmI